MGGLVDAGVVLLLELLLAFVADEAFGDGCTSAEDEEGRDADERGGAVVVGEEDFHVQAFS
ncbi:hypothetical protein D3C71_2196860 [compost metagenome]